MSHEPRRSDEPAWRPAAAFPALRERAAMLARIRSFFAQVGVLEVETPVLSQAAVTDPALWSLATTWHGPGVATPVYLHTSPEFAMKRLLAAGSGSIYQVARVFRDGERGRLHHPEFTLLEWYRPGWDYRRLMDEVVELLRAALRRPTLTAERLTYRDLFRERLGLDPWADDERSFARVAAAAGLGGPALSNLSRDGWLDLLLSHLLEPGLGRGCLTFVHDYPPTQAALSRCRQVPEPVAERFEVYLDGLELANGFQELTDAAEQLGRFEHDLASRRNAGQVVPPIDTRFIAALEAGLPDCSGVALGIDRLLMCHLGARHIDEVLAFPVERA